MSCALFAAIGLAQDAAVRLRADSRLVLVPVSVHDDRGRPLTGLHGESFRVFDDGVERRITHFDTEESPMALGIVLDASASMRRTAPMAPLAVAEVIGKAKEDDEFFLIEFKALARMLVPLTHDVAEIGRRIGRSEPEGKTALYDAVLLGLREILRSESPRRAIVVVTDGMDNQSLLSSAQIDRVIRESPVPIYTLAVVAGGLRAQELMAMEWLRRAAELTGGRKYESRAGELGEYARQIALDLRARYVLAFQAPGDGRYHRLRVEVTAPDGGKTRVTARPGYLAPVI